MTEVEMLELTVSTLEVAAAFMKNYATHLGIYLSLVFWILRCGLCSGTQIDQVSGNSCFTYVSCSG